MAVPKVVTDATIDAKWDDGVLAYTENGEAYENPFDLAAGVLTVDIEDENGVMVLIFKRVGDVDYVPSGDSNVEDAYVGDEETAGETGNLPIGRDELQGISDELKAAYDSLELREMTYEEIRDKFFNGVEGQYANVGGGITMYDWFPNDDSLVSVRVVFDENDEGVAIPSGISSFFP